MVPNYYVPLLRWRMGEYQALSKLNDAVRERTVPLVEVLPPDYDFELHKPRKHINEQLKPFVKQVAKHWSGRPAMIDAVQIPAPTRMGDGRHPLTYIFDDARTQGVSLLPVTALDRDGDYQRAVGEIVATDAKGIVLRCSLEDTIDPDFDKDAKALFLTLGVPAERVDILLDLRCPQFEPQDGLIGIISAALAQSEMIAKAHSVTMLATSFPDSLSALDYGATMLPRREWMLYKALVAALPSHVRRPGFGDYTIAAVSFPQGDMRYMRGSPNVRYAIDDAWLVAKAKRQKFQNNAAYPSLCGSIVNSGRFAGATFSEGSKYIDGCRLGIEKKGNPTTWKWVATNHHTTRVVEDLAKLSVS